jgi:hypothetical protein
MTPSDLDAAFAAANPLTGQAAAALPVHDAEAELIDRLVTTPVRRRPAPRPRRAPRRRRLALALVATAVVATVLTVVPLGGRGGGPTPAFAASLVRFANHTPLVLLRLPGWRVVYVYQQPGGYGEMHFVRGRADENGNPTSTSAQPVVGRFPTPRRISQVKNTSVGRFAQLTWYHATPKMKKWVAGGRERAETGLGVEARRFVREDSGPGWIDMTATFIYRGRELSFRATTANMAKFRQELRALSAVDTTTWLRAMPASVIKSADSTRVVHEMLKGIPLPPGFDAAHIRGADLTQNRYDLGAAVTGTVACMWIADWNHARHAGNSAMVHRAIAAMATSPHWPVLHQMAHQGAWPQVLIEYAHDMRRGTVVAGRVLPLTVDANSGLGCSRLGVHLGS